MRSGEAARRLTPFAFYAELLGAERRPQGVSGAARPGGQRRPRRVPQPRARLREPRDAVAAGLRRLAAHRVRRGQARHGDRARRGAGDDRARRQGPGSADRDPRRHHDAAGRPGAVPAAAACAAACATRAPDTPDCIVWMPRKRDDTAPITAARAQLRSRAAENEYRRLLYVAMTRAADRLVVCGAVGETAMPPGCWYELVEQGLDADRLAHRGAGRFRRRQRCGATARSPPDRAAGAPAREQPLPSDHAAGLADQRDAPAAPPRASRSRRRG